MTTDYKSTLLSLDANSFIVNDSTYESICIPDSTKEFMEKANTYRVLVGQKGTGKSLLLLAKKYNDSLRSKSDSTVLQNKVLLPSDKNIERIQLNGEVPYTELATYTVDSWTKIFDLAISYFIIYQNVDRIFEKELIAQEKFKSLAIHQHINPDGLKEDSIEFGSILDSCILNSKDLVFDNIREHKNPARIIINGLSKHFSISLYLDNLDQALYKVITKHSNVKKVDYIVNRFNVNLPIGDLLSDTKSDAPELQFWIKSQLGFLFSLHNLNELSPHKLKVYATLRYEAYYALEFVEQKSKAQIRSICKEIEYSIKDLTEIYNKLLSSAEIPSYWFHDMELSELKHTRVTNLDHNSETMIQHIFRHSFGNPRELTYQVIGLKNMYKRDDLIKGDKGNVDTMKEYLSKHSFKPIFDDLENETLPGFPTTDLNDFLDKVKRNYLGQDEINGKDWVLLEVLYRLGLLGVVEKKGKRLVQKFMKKNIYFQNIKQKLPTDSPFYLLHPTVDHILLEKFAMSPFYYPNCIIGHGLPFAMLEKIDYYIPNNLLERKINNSLSDRDGKKYDLFEKYYMLDSSFRNYMKIRDSFAAKWFPRLIKAKFDRREREELFAELKYQLGYGKNPANDNNPDPLLVAGNKKNITEHLRRNYKLRMILSVLISLNLIEDKNTLLDLFDGKAERALNITFFRDPWRSGKLDKEVFKSFLSDFEINIVYTSSVNFNWKSLPKNSLDERYIDLEKVKFNLTEFYLK